MIRGSCLCKGIQFEISGKISLSRYCHCENCRKFSGTGQAAWGLANASEFSQTSATTGIGKFDAGSGSMRCFCSGCGSPLWFEPKDMPDFIGIALGSIDSGDVDAPTSHLWVSSSPDWETIEGDLPRHNTKSQG